MTAPAPAAGVLDRAWQLSPRVSVRPEPFGALLYHFGTRRLSFLKDRTLLDVVRLLPDSASATRTPAWPRGSPRPSCPRTTGPWPSSPPPT